MERKMMDEKHQLKGKKSIEVSEEKPSTADYFDVFISFRSKDTRNGFTSHLCKELAETRGIITFIDSEHLKRGGKIDDLLKHIERSQIFVPVFSQNYADSKWCMKEITKMVEINKREGEKRPIIPIFYHVDPSEVMHLTSSFGNAFGRHLSDWRLSREQIYEWRTALTEAGNIFGFSPSNTEGNEAKLITLIGKYISNILYNVPFNHKVFISFSGMDTRKGFTSHLYKELAETRGITTFIDSEDLKSGEKISNLITHIERSKIFLPVFSKNYADSKWCLREITKMVEINKREGWKRPIIPIFYDVDPSDIKHPTSSFGKAFEKHQCDEKLSKEEINEWKTALTEAGNISGFCPSNTNGNEAELVTLIAKRVSDILRKIPFDI